MNRRLNTFINTDADDKYNIYLSYNGIKKNDQFTAELILYNL